MLFIGPRKRDIVPETEDQILRLLQVLQATVFEFQVNIATSSSTEIYEVACAAYLQ